MIFIYATRFSYLYRTKLSARPYISVYIGTTSHSSSQVCRSLIFLTYKRIHTFFTVFSFRTTSIWIIGFFSLHSRGSTAGTGRRVRNREELFKPRKGTKMVRCLTVRRNAPFIPPILFDRALAGPQKEEV